MSAPAVLIVSELYYPDDAATPHFLTGIAEGIAAHVRTGAVCCRPVYHLPATRVPWREVRNGVEIIRCRATRLDPNKLLSRATNALTSTCSMFFTLLRVVKRGQVLIVVTNPPTLPFIARFVSGLRGARCILLLHDVYPEALAAAGVMRRDGLVYRMLAAIAGRLYGKVDHVVVLGRDMARLAAAKGARRITIIPNWGDVDLVRREEHGPRDTFVVQYGGNIGRTHDLSALLDAAEAFRDDASLQFMIFGAGARRSEVEHDVASRRLNNVTLLPRLPAEELSASLNAADVAVVAMRAGMSGISVPSRLYNILAAGRPIIAIADHDSEIAMVVREEEIGWVVPPGDPAAFVDAIADARRDPARLEAMGRRARIAAEQKYTRSHAIDAYLALIETMRSA